MPYIENLQDIDLEGFEIAEESCPSIKDELSDSNFEEENFFDIDEGSSFDEDAYNIDTLTPEEFGNDFYFFFYFGVFKSSNVESKLFGIEKLFGYFLPLDGDRWYFFRKLI